MASGAKTRVVFKVAVVRQRNSVRAARAAVAPGQPDEDKAVSVPEARAMVVPDGYLELMAEGDVLERHVPTRAEHRAESAQEEA